MTDFEKINQLLGEVKDCTDADIHRYWSLMVQVFIPASKADRSESAAAFYQWAESNATEQRLKPSRRRSLTCCLLSLMQ